MAESGAHLTRVQHYRPSLFDFIVQDKLNSLLYETAKRIVTFKFDSSSVFNKWFDEIFYIAQYFLQRHYLKNCGATFCETLYGLQRTSLKNKGSNLTKNEILLSLFFCSAIPYLRQKLDNIANKIYFDYLPSEKEGWNCTFLKSIINLNKFSNLFLHAASLVQFVRYLSGKTDSVSPYLAASGLRLEYQGSDANQTGNPKISNSAEKVILRVFELSIFFLQFLAWWKAERSHYKISPIPPPPEVNDKASQFNGICPVCGGKRTLETALSVSGYVFCFKCLSEYVTKHKKCPVTDLPATLNNLIRLYPPN